MSGTYNSTVCSIRYVILHYLSGIVSYKMRVCVSVRPTEIAMNTELPVLPPELKYISHRIVLGTAKPNGTTRACVYLADATGA